MTKLLGTLRIALLARPTWLDLSRFGLELLWLVPCLGLCVLLSPVMVFDPVFDAATVRLALVAILIPSLGEELLFRASLLPRPAPDLPLPIGRSILAVALFALWHPLQALFASDARAAIFTDPWFLCATAALGWACARLYWRSGSIWPAVLLHWLIVVGWKSLAGGPALI